MYNFKGKVAIVTGAGSKLGIGNAIASRLAEEGCNLVLADICSPEKIEAVAAEIRKKGVEVLTTRTDVSRAEDVKKMVDSTLEKYAQIDFLINNAGVIRIKRFLEFTPEDWDLQYNVMVKGTYLCIQAVARKMIEMGTKGKIINMSSVGGKKAYPYAAAYGTCKRAVVHLTQAAAVELAEHNIKVNGIAPGDHWTEMLEDVYEKNAKIEGIGLEEFKEEARAEIPLGRLGETEDIANMCAFLLSTEADYITGQVVNVNGGMFME